MFLEQTKKRNPNLIKAAVLLHQNGLIPPNTFVIDADNVERNCKLMREEAKKWNLKVYFMLKQCRTPRIMKFVLDKNKKETVCCDLKDARVIWESGNLIGHIGHLVQTPDHDIKEILLMQPEVVTVFSVEKAKRISEEAGKLGIVQDLLLRVTGKDDVYYPSMEGGIKEEDVEEVAKEISKLKNVRIVGGTCYPAMNRQNTKFVEVTPNVGALLRCIEKLKKMGFPINQINQPGNTCTFSMEGHAKEGATHIEPGSGIVAHTPFSYAHDLPEVQSLVYVTEVLHKTDDAAFVEGGGFYLGDNYIVDKNFKHKALFGKDEDKILDNEADFIGCAVGNKEIMVDYYGLLKLDKKGINIGDTVIFAYGTQTQATRCANTAVVRGLREGKTILMGVYDHCCHRLQRYS